MNEKEIKRKQKTLMMMEVKKITRQNIIKLDKEKKITLLNTDDHKCKRK